MSDGPVTPRWLLFILGLGLVLNPLYVPAEEIGSPNHVYERASIEATGNVIEWAGGLHEPIAGIDCFEERTRLCGELEAATDERIDCRNVSCTRGSLDPYLALHSGWYRRALVETDTGRYIVLERVTAETVLAEVARDPDAVPDAVQPAARGERATVETKLEETYVVRADGEYYYLTKVKTERLPLRWAIGPLSWVAVLIGASLLVRCGERLPAPDEKSPGD